MNLEQIGSRICPSWHKAYAKAFGYDFSMPRFLLTGNARCQQIWETYECFALNVGVL